MADPRDSRDACATPASHQETAPQARASWVRSPVLLSRGGASFPGQGLLSAGADCAAACQGHPGVAAGSESKGQDGQMALGAEGSIEEEFFLLSCTLSCAPHCCSDFFVYITSLVFLRIPVMLPE